MKFHVFVAGDRSVGLQYIHAVVSFDDNVIWDEDMIASAKDLLHEFYDTPIVSVLTQDEHIKEQAALLEYERKYLSGE